MKTIWALLVVLLLSGWLIARSGQPVAPSRPASEAIAWRRTEAGWENSANWRAEQAGVAKPLHPGVVASFCLLASLLALTAFSSSRGTAESPSSPSTGQAAALGRT